MDHPRTAAGRPREEDRSWGARVAEVLRYHDLSSHHGPSRLAQGGAMDWSQQPDKFLRFRGAPMLDLPVFGGGDAAGPAAAGAGAAGSGLRPELLRIFGPPAAAPGRHGGSSEHGPPRASPPQSSQAAAGEEPSCWLARVLQEAFGLTAWKGQGAALWALRANASSGALQPCEAYVLAGSQAVPQWTGSGAALLHYNPFWHALEVLCELPEALWAGLECQLPRGGALVVITALYWRNAWKYGDPGVRYVHQDMGHYIGALGLACAAAGARAALLERVTDDDVGRLVGLQPASPPDDEQPHALLALSPPGAPAADARDFTLSGLPPAPFRNRAGRAVRTGSTLSAVNARGHKACRKTEVPPRDSSIWRRDPAPRPGMPCGSAAQLRRCIAARRSAHEFQASRALSLDGILDILRGIMPDAAPFDALPFSRPLVPLVLVFVHRVEGLAAGLYGLCRDESRLDWVKNCAPRYRWQAVEAAEAQGLPLFELQCPEDVREVAQVLSCQQEWAGNSCLALALFVEYVPLLQEHGPWMYQRAHWEAGMIGQSLYIGAESVGCRGTAMGCFFGPLAHQHLGIDKERLQDVEHFTLGYALEDMRVQTILPYAHLPRFRELHDRDAVDTGREDKAVAELAQTVRGNCRACSLRDAEGRMGTESFTGQFFCGRCWAEWDPRIRASEEAFAREDARLRASAAAASSAAPRLRGGGGGDAGRVDCHQPSKPLLMPPAEFECVD